MESLARQRRLFAASNYQLPDTGGPYSWILAIWRLVWSVQRLCRRRGGGSGEEKSTKARIKDEIFPSSLWRKTLGTTGYWVRLVVQNRNSQRRLKPKDTL